jgi:predicted HAD superfamily Cof-like phosphohydrolase
LPNERIRLRAKLIAEEFFETMRAMFGRVGAGLEAAEDIVMTGIKLNATCVDMIELADGMADLDYVVEGARIEFGIDGSPIAREVHRSNMAKIGGAVRADGKKLKPAGWTPPDVAGCLRNQGWCAP